MVVSVTLGLMHFTFYLINAKCMKHKVTDPTM